MGGILVDCNDKIDNLRGNISDIIWKSELPGEEVRI